MKLPALFINPGMPEFMRVVGMAEKPAAVAASATLDPGSLPKPEWSVSAPSGRPPPGLGTPTPSSAARNVFPKEFFVRHGSETEFLNEIMD